MNSKRERKEPCKKEERRKKRMKVRREKIKAVKAVRKTREASKKRTGGKGNRERNIERSENIRKIRL